MNTYLLIYIIVSYVLGLYFVPKLIRYWVKRPLNVDSLSNCGFHDGEKILICYLLSPLICPFLFLMLFVCYFGMFLDFIFTKWIKLIGVDK